MWIRRIRNIGSGCVEHIDPLEIPEGAEISLVGDGSGDVMNRGVIRSYVDATVDGHVHQLEYDSDEEKFVLHDEHPYKCRFTGQMVDPYGEVCACARPTQGGNFLAYVLRSGRPECAAYVDPNGTILRVVTEDEFEYSEQWDVDPIEISTEVLAEVEDEARAAFFPVGEARYDESETCLRLGDVYQVPGGYRIVWDRVYWHSYEGAHDDVHKDLWHVDHCTSLEKEELDPAFRVRFY